MVNKIMTHSILVQGTICHGTAVVVDVVVVVGAVGAVGALGAVAMKIALLKLLLSCMIV